MMPVETKKAIHPSKAEAYIICWIFICEIGYTESSVQVSFIFLGSESENRMRPFIFAIGKLHDVYWFTVPNLSM